MNKSLVLGILGVASAITMAQMINSSPHIIAVGGASSVGGGTNINNNTNYIVTNPTELTYNIKDFGAVGDGKFGRGWQVVASNTFVTNPLASFTSADIGKRVTIWAAGFTNFAFVPTNFGSSFTLGYFMTNWLNHSSGISNVISSTVIQISNAASHTVTNELGAYGTDDTVAIQTAINQVATNNGGTIYVPKGVYIIAGELQDTGAYSNHHNAQLYFPKIPYEGMYPITVGFRGVMPLSWEVQNPNVNPTNYVSIFLSTLSRGPTNNTGQGFYQPKGSVLDCRDLSGTPFRSSSPPGGDVNAIVPINPLNFESVNMMWVACFDADLAVLNLAGADGMFIDANLITSGTRNGTNYGGMYSGTNSGFAIVAPNNFNASRVVMQNSFIFGFNTAIGIWGNGFYPNFWMSQCWDGVAGIAGGDTEQFPGMCVQSVKNIFRSRTGAEWKIRATASVQEATVCNFGPTVILQNMDQGGTLNHALSGQIIYDFNSSEYQGIGFYTNNILQVFQDAVSPQVEIIRHDLDVGPTIKQGPGLFQWGRNSLSPSIGIGADSDNISMTASVSKLATIGFPRFIDTNFLYCNLFGFRGLNANNTIMEIGWDGIGGGGLVKGATLMRFYTAATPTATPTQVGSFESTGEFTSQTVSTSRSNLLAPTLIVVGASPFSVTNLAALHGGTDFNINVFISGQVSASITVNGGVLYSNIVTAPVTVPLKPNDYLTLTYTGPPSMRWRPQ